MSPQHSAELAALTVAVAQANAHMVLLTTLVIVDLVLGVAIAAERIASFWLARNQNALVNRDNQQIFDRLDAVEVSSSQALEFSKEATHTTKATGEKVDRAKEILVETKQMAVESAQAAATVARQLADAGGPVPVVVVAQPDGSEHGGVVVKPGTVTPP